MTIAIIAAVLAFVCHACASPALAPPAAKTAEVASSRALPPTVEELKNATYAGLGERLGPVTLANGRWTGAPPALGEHLVEVLTDWLGWTSDQIKQFSSADSHARRAQA